jgi:sirohydrochlorin ferrochelatase
VKTGVVLFAHGSRVAEANEAVRAVATRLREEGRFHLVEAAFLELASPDLPQAVASQIEAGAGRVIVVPYFLTLGTHLQRDLPRIVAEIQRIHIGIEIEVTAPLDDHPALFEAVLDRAREAAAGKRESPESPTG